MKKKITLLKLKQGNGNSGQTVIAEKTVWADVTDVGVTTKFNAMSIGKSVDLQATVFRKEFDGHSHADISGNRYRIESTGSTSNDLVIKLLLSRGG